MSKRLKIAINVSILVLVAGFIWYMATSVNKEDITYAQAGTEDAGAFVSPYKQVSTFNLPEEINRFELQEGKLFISAGQSVYLYDTKGNELSSFTVNPDVRDITVGEEKIYLLYPAHIEVYSLEGEMIHQWEACSELSDYCSFTLAGDYVFVTDAENKNICKYTKEGNFVKFIHSPRDFIIPSYSFDIESRNDTIFCVNSGRHLVETYTMDGEFIAAFGGPGGKAGFFAGCCNPVYISFAPDGELITSEKGNPRISAYERNGNFKEVLLNSRMLGGGNKAYEVYAQEDLLFIAGKNMISIFQYNDTTRG